MESEKEFKDIKIRPFISANLLRFIAIILLGIAEIASLMLIYTKMTGELTEDLEKGLKFFKSLVNLSTPFILVTILANITRNTDKLKKYCIIYFVLATLFYLFEILIFRLFIVPFLEETFLYMLNVEGEMPAEAHKFILQIVSYISAVFANLNTFLDVFICSLFAFFTLYTPNFKTKKRLTIFRLMAIIPVLYFLASCVLNGLNKLGIVSFGIEVGALLVHRSYVCFLFFFIVVLLLKYREKKINANDKIVMRYEQYEYTNKGLFAFNIIIIAIILILSLLDFLLSFIPNSSYFNIGSSYFIVLSTPILLFFNRQRKKHNKTTTVLVSVYMAFIGFLALGFFVLITSEAMKYVEMVAEIFRAINP